GYRLSREDANGTTFGPLGTTAPDVRSFTDTNVPATGGAYFYRIETLRKSPGGLLASSSVTTAAALTVDGTPGSVSGSGSGSGGGGSGAGGPTHYDSTTLAADEGEPGGDDPLAALPGGNTI